MILHNKLVKISGLVLLLVLLVFLLLGFLRFGTIWFLFEIWEWVAVKLQNSFHFHKYLTYALAIPLMIGIYKLVRYSFSLSKKKRWLAIYLLSGVIMILFFSLFIIQKDWIFDASTGEAMQCFTRNPSNGKLELLPCSNKIHPMWGTKTFPATEDLLQEYYAQKGRVSNVERIEPNESTRFFTANGSPLLWYYQRPSGKLEFYNYSGNHPQFGDVTLVPISTEIVQKVFKYIETGQDSMIIGNNSSTSKKLKSTLEKYYTGKGLDDAIDFFKDMAGEN